MNKINRNSSCSCGSGKKFKRCCLDKETKMAPLEDLDELSYNSINLIKKGKLEEAEILAQKLIKGFPELHDGLEHMAMIYEARKFFPKAEEYYKMAVKVVNLNGGYDVSFSEHLIEKANKMRLKRNE